MSIALREGVQRLEITTRVTLGVLALGSGVYTYLGVRDLLNGNATVVFFAAVIYSVAVSIGIYAFWTFLMRFLPHVRDAKSRGLLFGCMAARLADDHRHVGLAECFGARRRRRDPAASRRSPCRPIPATSTRRISQRARGAEPACPTSRWRRRASPSWPNPSAAARSPARRARARWCSCSTQMSTQLGKLSQEVTQSAEQVEDAVRAGRQASGEDARARLRPRPDQCRAATPSAAKPWR